MSLSSANDDRVVDQRLVVGRDRREATGRERALDQARVGGVDVALLRVRDLLGLEVGALDEAQVRLEGEQLLEVGRRAVEVRLEDGADVVVALLAQRPEHAQRRVDERRLLHVEPDEVADAGGVRDELADVRARELLVEAEPEVRQLQRDVDPQPLGRDAVEDLPVRLDDDARLGLVVDALAEQRRVGLEAAVVEPPQHDDRVVERLAGDEPGRAEAHPVPAHAPLQPRAVRGGEDRLPQGRLDSGEGRHLGSGLYATATNRPVRNGRAQMQCLPEGVPSCRKCDEVSTGVPVESHT